MLIKILKKKYYFYIFIIFFHNKKSLETFNLPLSKNNIKEISQDNPSVLYRSIYKADIKNNSLTFLTIFSVIFIIFFVKNNFIDYFIIIPSIIIISFSFFHYYKTQRFIFKLFLIIYYIINIILIVIFIVFFKKINNDNNIKIIFLYIFIPMVLLNIFQYNWYTWFFNCFFFIVCGFNFLYENLDNVENFLNNKHFFQLIIFFIIIFTVEFFLEFLNKYKYHVSYILVVGLLLNNIFYFNKNNIIFFVYYNSLFINLLLFFTKDSKNIFIKTIYLFNKKFFDYNRFFKFFLKILLLYPGSKILKDFILLNDDVKSTENKLIINIFNIIFHVFFDLFLSSMIIYFFYYHIKKLINNYIQLKKSFIDKSYFILYYKFFITEIIITTGLFTITVIFLLFFMGIKYDKKYNRFINFINIYYLYLIYFFIRKNHHLIYELITNLYHLNIYEVKKRKSHLKKINKIMENNLENINFVLKNKDNPEMIEKLCNIFNISPKSIEQEEQDKEKKEEEEKKLIEEEKKMFSNIM